MSCQWNHFKLSLQLKNLAHGYVENAYSQPFFQHLCRILKEERIAREAEERRLREEEARAMAEEQRKRDEAQRLQEEKEAEEKAKAEQEENIRLQKQVY